MDEHTKEKAAVGLHTVLGVVVGYLSILFPKLVAVPAGLVVMAATVVVSAKLFRVGARAALAGNIFVYLMVWLVMWTFFLSW